MGSIDDMSTKEVIAKIESGVLSSCSYDSFTDYVKAMEE